MEYTTQLQIIDEMNQAALSSDQWGYRINDLNDANELLETSIRLMGAALGDFDVTNDLQVIAAQHTALTLVEKSCAETPDSSICTELPATLSESRIMNQILARMAAQWLTQTAGDNTHAHLQHLHQRLTDTEATLTRTTPGSHTHD